MDSCQPRLPKLLKRTRGIKDVYLWIVIAALGMLHVISSRAQHSAKETTSLYAKSQNLRISNEQSRWSLSSVPMVVQRFVPVPPSLSLTIR